jgi:hypothetical protein
LQYKFIFTCILVSLGLLNVSTRAEPLQVTTPIVVNSIDDTATREAITAANTDSNYEGECAAGSSDDTINLTGISGIIHLISPLAVDLFAGCNQVMIDPPLVTEGGYGVGMSVSVPLRDRSVEEIDGRSENDA